MAPAWLEKFIVREDATPDPRRSSGEQPVLEIHYTVLEGHRRILGVKGDRKPRYEVTRKAVLGVWGDKCHVAAPGGEGMREIATIDFHSIPSASTEVQFLQHGGGHGSHKIKIKGAGAGNSYDLGNGGLGRLHWKATGTVPYGKASWEVRDESDDLVVSVAIDDHQMNGVISLWRKGLGAEAVEELVVVGVSKLEEYRRLMRQSKTAAVGVAANAVWLAAV